MPRRGEISEVVDSLLKFTITGGVLTLGLLAPGSTQALEKPVYRYFKKIDKRKRQREYQRVIRYMKQNKLIKGDYEHGLQITDAGRERAIKSDIDNIELPRHKKWDGSWRIVLFDVPEEHKSSRDSFTRKIRELGFYQLQKSVWIYPYECRKEIETTAALLEVDKFITYIETKHIDKQESLKEHFKF